ncbi:MULTISPECIES: DUF2130 domain-containing protein [unclassified Bradyrhizobium]|uniref:DUF2130 domain-containing protein n=1 Tax=unclassified Bradyrhizobium TaxID=2631580 RepID=UPI002915D3B0|nr:MULTISPECIES: DUF2130 domain-containing protein [unclassified Bradyrhizobium]
MASPQSSAASVAAPLSATSIHLHVAGEVCPVCDQPIPHDRAEEVAERLEAREREQSAAISARLQEKFNAEKAEAIERVRLETAEKVATAREEARLAAEAQSKVHIDTADQARAAAQEALRLKTEEAEEAKAGAETAQAALQKAKAEAAEKEAAIRSEATRIASEAAAGKIAEAEASKATTEQANAALQDQLDVVKRDSQATLEKVKAEAAANEASIRVEATRIADEAAAAKIAEVESQKMAAEQAGAVLQTKLQEIQRHREQALAQAKAEAAEREVAVRAEVAAAAEERITGAEQAKAEALAKVAAAEAQARTQQESHEVQLAERLREQREALETAKTEAVNAEKAAVFEDKLKLSAKVEELQRALDKKTAEELGEGAEIDLFEALKAEFDGDRIERVGKGQPGADILHTVINNGRECGQIIYDSKNHNAWRNDFVAKLRSDQMAAKAEHAILSTRKFPSGERHLHVQDGILIASPARVVALVQIVRQHLVQTHTLRMSNEERTQKMAALYDFITSQQCADMLAALDTQAETLLEIQVKEKKAHEAVWKQQGILIRSSQKVHAELRNSIDSIIGIASAPEVTP